MKKLIVALGLPLILLLTACGGKSYTLETYYSSNASSGDTTMTTKQDKISAESDSVAYVKGLKKFKELMADNDKKDGQIVKFLIRNSDGIIVPSPEQSRHKQDEKLMYPNQTSP